MPPYVTRVIVGLLLGFALTLPVPLIADPGDVKVIDQCDAHTGIYARVSPSGLTEYGVIKDGVLGPSFLTIMWVDQVATRIILRGQPVDKDQFMLQYPAPCALLGVNKS